MSKTAFDFAAALAQLESLVAELESGKLDLHASVEKFETGLDLAAKLKQELAKTEKRITVIRQKVTAKPSV